VQGCSLIQLSCFEKQKEKYLSQHYQVTIKKANRQLVSTSTTKIMWNKTNQKKKPTTTQKQNKTKQKTKKKKNNNNSTN
jgi:hypothetical protein